MATDDCSEIGRGPCPCGKGIITVEMCIPDHPWAKASQARYTPALVCDVCGPQYTFHQANALTRKSRLVSRSELQKYQQARDGWHRKLREIETTSAFKDLAKQLGIRLAAEKSAAARYRLLSSAKLATGLSLGRYRRDGYELSALHVQEALALLGIKSPELEKLAQEAEQLAESRHTPAGIKTGISGLEM